MRALISPTRVKKKKRRLLPRRNNKFVLHRNTTYENIFRVIQHFLHSARAIILHVCDDGAEIHPPAERVLSSSSLLYSREDKKKNRKEGMKNNPGIHFFVYFSNSFLLSRRLPPPLARAVISSSYHISSHHLSQVIFNVISLHASSPTRRHVIPIPPITFF